MQNAEIVTAGRRQGLRFTEWIPSASILGVSLITAALWLVGPAPHKESSPRGLWPEQAPYAIQEPTDKLILFCWWVLPASIVLIGLWLTRSRRSSRRGMPRAVSILQAATAVVASALVVAASLWKVDVWGYWRGISIMSLLGGFIFALVLYLGWRASRRVNLWVSFAVTAVVLVFLFPALAESAWHLRDPYDFGFTGDEMVAPATGRFPLGGYVSQYSNLLGYPLIPVLKWFSSYAAVIAVSWLVFLQIVLIIGAISIPLIVSGRRMLGGAVLLVAAPLMISGTGTTQTPLSYFANIPLRTVLPVLLIVAALLILPRSVKCIRQVRVMLPLGLIAGVTALNNADFGLPAVLVVAVAIPLIFRASAPGWKALVLFIGSTVIVPIFYFLLLLLLGRHPSPADYLLYPRTFAIDGFYQSPMEPFGLHIAAASLFVSATAIGAWLLMRGRGAPTSFSRREGLALLLCGGWSLLSLVYFAGRSFVPTFIGGTALQIGLVAAAFLPLIRATLRRARWYSGWSSVGPRSAILFSVILVTVVSSLLWQARKPVDSLIDYLDSGSGTSSSVNGNAFPYLGEDNSIFEGAGKVGQMLPASSLTSLEAGLPSALRFNSPEVFSISPAFTSRQCELLKQDSFDSVVVDSAYVAFLNRDGVCRSVLDFAGAKTFGDSARPLALIALKSG